MAMIDANKSPSGLLNQLEVTSAVATAILDAETSTHVNRIHVYNPGASPTAFTLYHLELSESTPALKNVIQIGTIAAGAVWVFESQSQGSTISLAKSESLFLLTATETTYCSVYGHGSQR